MARTAERAASRYSVWSAAKERANVSTSKIDGSQGHSFAEVTKRKTTINCETPFLLLHPQPHHRHTVYLAGQTNQCELRQPAETGWHVHHIVASIPCLLAVHLSHPFYSAWQHPSPGGRPDSGQTGALVSTRGPCGFVAQGTICL